MSTHAYGRGSTRKQEASPEVQRQQLKDYCLLQGWGEPLWHLDKSTTSKIPLLERTAGQQLHHALRPGDRVVFTKLDRGFRNLREFVNVMEDWSRIGVTVHILNFMGGNAIDFSSPVGKLCVQMLAAVAEFERATTAERTRETLKHLKAAGGVAGQPQLGFKYVRVCINGKMKHRAVPDIEERKQMRHVLNRRNENPPWSWDEIREEMNYKLKWFRTKKHGPDKNREWSVPALLRAAKAELVLQKREASSRRVAVDDCQLQEQETISE
jgi:putative DNA-invertase from lambdoid prophage Rac